MHKLAERGAAVSAYTFLSTAFYLSVLAYYIGVLIYMLPIPFYGLKKWAPQLMIDGIFSAILVFSYTIILVVVEKLGAMTGASWDWLYSWLFIKANMIALLILALKFIGTALSGTGLAFLANSFISPLISTLTYVLIFLLTLTVFSTLIIMYGSELLALGIMLHSVPFRITRGSGALMISMVIVFTIGLPLMPSYVDFLSASILLPNQRLATMGYAPVEIRVHDSVGNPVSYPVFAAIDNGETIARYKGCRNGTVDATGLEKGLPSAAPYTARIEYGGARYEVEIDPSRDYLRGGEAYLLNIALPGIIEVAELRYLAVTPPSIIGGSRNSTCAVVVAAPQIPSVLFIAVVDGDSFALAVDGNAVEPSESYSYEWGGIVFHAYRYQLAPGVHTITVCITPSGGTVEPSIDEIYYMRQTVNVSITDPVSLVAPVSFIVFNLLVAPLSYIAILVSATYMLSRLLGGTSPGLMRILTLRVI